MMDRLPSTAIAQVVRMAARGAEPLHGQLVQQHQGRDVARGDQRELHHATHGCVTIE